MISVKRALCIILTAFLLLICIPQPRASAQPASNEIKTGIGYTFLKTDAQRKMYMQMAQCAADLRPSLEFDAGNSSIEEIWFVLDMFYADFPEFHWVGNDYGGSPIILKYSNAEGIVVPAYSQEFLTKYEHFNRKVYQIIEGIPSNLESDLEIVWYLWDYVSTNVSYAVDNMGQSAYCALVKGEAKCYGYARALSCLLKKVGIASMPVTGTKNGMPHAWNAVWLDGKCYYLEPQHPSINPLYSLEEMEQMGYVLDASFLSALPSTCNHHIDNPQWVSFSGGYDIDTSTPIEKVVSRFSGWFTDGFPNIFTCQINYLGSNFDAWMESNSPEILRLLGCANDAKITYYLDDGSSSPTDVRLYMITIQDSKIHDNHYPVYEVAIGQDEVHFASKFQSFDLNPRVFPTYAANKAISCTSSNTNVATVNSEGVITPVGNGTATITVTADGVTASCQVTVNLDLHSHPVPLRHVAARASDCYNNGNKEYYICDDCGEWFEDANAKKLITDKLKHTTPATGHNYSDEWYPYEYYHYKYCMNPQCYVEGSTIEEVHSDANGDGACDVCGYGAQSTTTPSVTEPNQTIPTQKPTDSTTTTPSNPTSPPTTSPTQQTSPSDTTDPSETTTPSNPTNPTDSTAPSVPTSQPTIPSDPTESTSSSDPLTPSVGSTTETSATPSGTTAAGNPEPGNDDHPNSTWIIYVALLLGVGGIISYLIYKRKVKSP